MLVELMSLIVYKLCINNKQFIALELSHCHAVWTETCSFDAETEMAALFLKQCHLIGENVTKFTVLT